MSRKRYTAVCWLAQADLEPMGAPETTVEIGDDITHGLRIVAPFGRETDALLEVHASRETGQITLAIAAMVALEQAPYPVRRNYEPYLDGPRTQADGWHDDNGANDPDGA